MFSQTVVGEQTAQTAIRREQSAIRQYSVCWLRLLLFVLGYGAIFADEASLGVEFVETVPDRPLDGADSDGNPGDCSTHTPLGRLPPHRKPILV
jgi:hypothetical protein